MGDNTGIEWCDATINPVIGCSIASPGCKNCYAQIMARRLGAIASTPQYRDLTHIVNGRAVWTGATEIVESQLQKPLAWRRPHRIFVCSMGDLFHESVPAAWIDRVLAMTESCPRHTFMILTKRAGRMRDYFADKSPLPNVWLGVTVEDQTRADERIPQLLDTPAAVRFVSVEPMLGAISINNIGRLDWVICGAETGPRARPMSDDWARNLRDQCISVGTPFFLKKLSSKSRELDGRRWEQFPTAH